MNGHLFRSRDDRMLAGVAGGLAELWDADPSLVRIVWALLIPLTGGVALVVYIVMAIVVPEEDGSSLAGQAIAWNAGKGSSSSGDARPDASTDATPSATSTAGRAPDPAAAASFAGTGQTSPTSGRPPSARGARRADVPRRGARRATHRSR